MKLLYCIPSLYNPGGMERILCEKVNFLATIPNFEVAIVTTDQSGLPVFYKLDDRIKLYHFNIDFNAHYSEKIIKKYFSHRSKIKLYKSKLSNLLNTTNVDICISLCGKEIDFLYKLPVQCKKIAEIHFAMNFRKQFLSSRKKGILWELLGNIRTKQLIKHVNRLDKLVVLTKNDENQWKKYISNVIQIPNFCPFTERRMSILDKKQAISVGKLDAQKGYDMLIEAWVIVNKNFPEWVLNIYGQGEWYDMLNLRINELKLNHTIKLNKPTTDIQSKYTESSLYIMSSRYEGLPMVLIEAMSCGLPVVSFDCEYGPSEIIKNDIDGYLIEPNNITELANKISLLIQNEDKRSKMGKEAFKNIARFDKKQIMSEWILLFNSLIN